MILKKENKFYVIILEENFETKETNKNKQKYWNNRKKRHNKIKYKKY